MPKDKKTDICKECGGDCKEIGTFLGHPIGSHKGYYYIKSVDKWVCKNCFNELNKNPEFKYKIKLKMSFKNKKTGSILNDRYEYISGITKKELLDKIENAIDRMIIIEEMNKQ